MKTGRNAPCPCRSGKKFKHCCLNAQPETEWSPDALSSAALPAQPASKIEDLDCGLTALVREGAPALVQGMATQVRRTILQAKADPQWAEASYEARRVDLLIERIQDEARIILTGAGRSTHYQYQLVRRLIPIMARTIGFAWFGPHSDYLGSSDFLVEIVRYATRLVIASGRPTEVGETPSEWRSTTKGQGINYALADHQRILACAKVVALAALWHDCAVKFRYASKEHTIFDQAGLPAALGQTDDVASYEKRRDLYQTIAGASGFWIDPDRYEPLNSSWCGWFTLIGSRDTRRSFTCRLGTEKFSASFLCMPLIDYRGLKRAADANRAKQLGVRLLPYDRLIMERAEWYRALLGDMPPEAINAFLYALYDLVRAEFGFANLEIGKNPLTCHWPEDRGLALDKLREVGQIGIIRARRESWIEAVVAHCHTVVADDQSIYKLSPSEVERLIRTFSLSPGQGLDRDEPFLFVVPSSQLLVLDAVFAVDFIAQLLLWPATAFNRRHPALSQLGDPGGDHLERASFEYFVRRFNLDIDKCLINKDVGGTEVDIAFVFRRMLVAIDCKAKSKNWEYTRGFHRVIRNRATEFRSELGDKLPRRIRLIREGKASPVIEPSAFDQSVGLVCATAVEYLPLDEPLFWRDGIPLVGPPDELAASIEQLVN